MECSNNADNGAMGDVLVHRLWKRGESCILDMRVMGTDAKSYRGSTSAKVLEKSTRARAYKKRIANLLADKWS